MIAKCEVCKPKGIICQKLPDDLLYRQRIDLDFDGRKRKIVVYGSIESCLLKERTIYERQNGGNGRKS